MNLIIHLVKTDIRRSRALLLVWLLLLALQGMLGSFGMNTANPGSQMFTSMIAQLMPQLEMLLFFVFVAFVVLADPLVGTTGFWLTRPISRSTLLKSKALFAAVVLVLPAVIVEVAGFAVHRIALPDIALLWRPRRRKLGRHRSWRPR
jgi:ABC-type transport system involved in multi-copper enzyme maturation permease subunit